MSTALTQLLIFRLSYLTSYIRGSAYVLTTQTNLYKHQASAPLFLATLLKRKLDFQQLFYLLNHMLYTYSSRPYTTLIYLTITYLCNHVSVSLCVHVYHMSVPSSTLSGSPLNYTYFISYLYRICEC